VFSQGNFGSSLYYLTLQYTFGIVLIGTALNYALSIEKF